jgi:hypothetical protein
MYNPDAFFETLQSQEDARAQFEELAEMNGCLGDEEEAEFVDEEPDDQPDELTEHDDFAHDGDLDNLDCESYEG